MPLPFLEVLEMRARLQTVNFGMRCILVRMRMRLLNSSDCDYLTNDCELFRHERKEQL